MSRRYAPQRASIIRAGTPNATGARSFSIAIPPAIAEAVPPGTVFWASLDKDGSLVFRPLTVVPHETAGAAKKSSKKPANAP